ncbi:MAG: glycoside hydrolase family 127 protein [Pirellulales bacterium]
MQSTKRQIGLILLSLMLPAATVACAAERPSPHVVTHPLPLSDVKWTDGFWAERFDVNRSQSIPAMWEIMRGTKYKPFLVHFQIAAGDAEGDYHGAPWNDGDFYKFLEGVTATYAVTGDAKLLAILDESIDVIARAQRADGYIHTPVLIRQRHGDQTAQPFQDRHNFEMYNMGHLITAACLHHQVTGSDKFLNVARKTADFLEKTFADPSPELARNSVCPSHYMAMVDLYRVTGEKRYLALAEKFLDMRNIAIPDGGDDNQDRMPFVEQREALGHAVRANYLFAGAADLYAEDGDEKLLSALEPIWDNVVHKKLYITGACGALYDGASPDGSEDQAHITRVHQAYGRNYQLPNTTAHNETCAAIGNVLWNWRMFLITGEARYVDVLELALYNAVLSGVSLDGTDYFYVNPLRQTEPLPTALRWPRVRVPFMTSFCCPPNVLRTIAEVGGFAYSTSDDAVWVNLYGGNTLATKLGGKPLKLRQETKYPWEGNVRITIDQCPANEFALKLRIPGWAEAATISVNGKADSAIALPGTYATLRRAWMSGDVVELDLKMLPQLVEANPLVEEARNQVAIQRGPIVYCLESPDLPPGVRVAEVSFPTNAWLTARFDPNLLGGVTVIETEGVAASSGDWEGQLYRPLAAGKTRRIPLRLIPYFAWSNRGQSEMSVWLPRD